MKGGREGMRGGGPQAPEQQCWEYGARSPLLRRGFAFPTICLPHVHPRVPVELWSFDFAMKKYGILFQLAVDCSLHGQEAVKTVQFKMERLKLNQQLEGQCSVHR